MIRILLACGIGASSGFMAASMRKISKKKGVDVSVAAVSKSEVMNHIGKFDILLLGPHFAADLGKYRDMLKGENVLVTVIDADYYSTLDGEGVLNDAIDFYKANRP